MQGLIHVLVSCCDHKEIATLACMLGNPLSGPELNEAMEAMDKDGRLVQHFEILRLLQCNILNTVLV